MNCNDTTTTASADGGGCNNKCSAENVWTNEKKSIYSESNDDDMSKSIISNNKEDNNNNNTVWNKIYELRSRLANDVICDPPPSNDNNHNIDNKNDMISSYNFPTFISPFDMSSTTTTSTNSTNSKVGSGGGGAVPLIYCDQTASQRPIQSIENYLRDNSMSCYANTHTVRVIIRCLVVLYFDLFKLFVQLFYLFDLGVY